jgi:hypothetical protein
MGGFTNYTDQDFANLLARVNQLDGFASTNRPLPR